MLQMGSQGPAVKELQQKLITRGYNVGPAGADGDFGKGTYDAVMRFQKDQGLAADGIVGPDTMRAIDGSIGVVILRKGDRGPAVMELQTKLISKGYSVGSYGADGDFGQGTYDAVMKFQKDNRLDADGVVGPATWNILNGFSNGSLLKKGDKGTEVKKLQEKLIARGYSVGSYGADGDFGQGTHDAVTKFQKDNGLDADGVVGPATWEVLNGYNSNKLLKKGDKGPEVKELQQKLIARGYSVGSYGADGDFGQGTHDAVMKFQRDNGLDADGVVGPKTLYALNANPSGTLLKLGSKGEEVRNLQERLISRGYSIGTYGADGDFGQATHDAVVKFQRDNGLDADGVVGPATWAALGTNDTLLRLGSKGSEVKRLQEKLISKGYSVGPAGADGDFGQGTHDAVIKFQRDNGLDVDGVVGPATWSVLNGFGDWNPGIAGNPGVKKMLSAAKSQLGVKETPVNINPYGAWYGYNGVPWCAIFVSWSANQGGILGNVVLKFHWCADGVNWYKARGRYMTRAAGTPDPGDVIFFYTSKDAFYHVGIVDYVANGKVYTVEGNATDAVRSLSYSLTDSRIHGYGRNGGIVNEDNTEDVLKPVIAYAHTIKATNLHDNMLSAATDIPTLYQIPKGTSVPVNGMNDYCYMVRYNNQNKYVNKLSLDMFAQLENLGNLTKFEDEMRDVLNGMNVNQIPKVDVYTTFATSTYMFQAYHKTNENLTNEIFRRDLDMYMRSRKTKKYYNIPAENMTPKSKYGSFKEAFKVAGNPFKDKLVYLGAALSSVEKAFSYIKDCHQNNKRINWAYVVDTVLTNFTHEVIKAASVTAITAVIVGFIGSLIGFSGGAIAGGALAILAIVINLLLSMLFGDVIDMTLQHVKEFLEGLFIEVEKALF